MRKVRVALLLALVCALAAVFAAHYASQKRAVLLAPQKPAPLPPEVGSKANNWSWSRSAENRPIVEVRAQDFRQIKDSSRFELEEIDLKIFSKDGTRYDWVRSRRAEFDQHAERLSSQGEVTITLGLPAQGERPPGKRYVEIRTSGLDYDNKTGVASTDRPAQFQFEDGQGRSNGAVYDSANRYLWMKSDAEINGDSGMRIRAGELHYWEAEQKVELRPWSSLESGNQGVRAGASTVFLDQGRPQRIEAEKGQGWSRSPGREVRFSGTWIQVSFTPQRTVGTVTGTDGAEVVSRSASGVTKMSGRQVELEFVTPEGATESQLAGAVVTEQARVENETRVLTSEKIRLKMKPGGEEVDAVETLAAGKLEFAPQQPSQWRRVLTAQRIVAQYLAGNRIETLRAFGRVALRSDPPAAAPRSQPPRLTWSEDLQALFDPRTGDLRELRQWNGFRFEEGARRAWSAGARFDLPEDRIYLDDGARVWDAATQSTAKFFVLDQKRDRFQAEGEVRSSHMEGNREKGIGNRDRSGEALFASDRPVHAVAKRMDSEQGNRLLHYRGGARLWQEASSVQGEEIDLDREAKTLAARGGVVTVLVEDGAAGKPVRPVTISSDSLEYSDDSHRAFYRGHVMLRREAMTVRCDQLEAFLRPQAEVKPGESRLERALAEGAVEIVETGPDPRAARRGAAGQAEYFAGEGKVILRGGQPQIEQPGRGFTRGAELTYHINDDRLLVSGSPGARSLTRQTLRKNGR